MPILDVLLSDVQSSYAWVSSQSFVFYAQVAAGVVLVGAVKRIISRVVDIWS